MKPERQPETQNPQNRLRFDSKKSLSYQSLQILAHHENGFHGTLKYDYAFGRFGDEGHPKVIIWEYDWIYREYVRLPCHLELHEEQLIRCSGRKKILKSYGHYDQRPMKTHCFTLIEWKPPAPPFRVVGVKRVRLGWWGAMKKP